MENDHENFSAYVAVIVDNYIDKTLEYGLSSLQLAIARSGSRVIIPLKNQKVRGYITAIYNERTTPRIKGIIDVVNDESALPAELFQLALWLSKYYCAPLRKVLKLLLPPGIRKEASSKQQLFVMRAKTREELARHCEQMRISAPSQANVLDVLLKVKKGILLTELLENSKANRSSVDSLKKKGLIEIDIVRIDRSPLMNEEYFPTQPKKLNEAQDEALQKMKDALLHKRFETHLLFGVTGSGKTEVYLQAIEKTIALGRGVIMLVPEISLTPQTIERFQGRFGKNIAILHHRLSDGERTDEWRRLQRGEAQIAIGARSAVFSPVKDLGLIIVDEEHEGSYKHTEDAPCYHARDVAIMRGKLENALVILGSATPSLESYWNATQGKYTLSELNVRAGISAMIPHFNIVDMKKERDKAKQSTVFSDILLSGIKNRIDKGEQTILFLNRRGYHTALYCKGCEKTVSCIHCSTSLTHHRGDQILSCHLCGYSLNPSIKSCPYCESLDTMQLRGIGTDQAERTLYAIFPDIRIVRMDADTTKHKGSHQKLFREFGTGKGDVLLGTQMIAKGLHFPNVTLVGVLNSDASLQLPDFRASETTFQLITQVAGRAGRGAVAGEVIVQSFMPENEVIQLAAKQDYLTFYKNEIEIRRLFDYPPHKSMIKIQASSTSEKSASFWLTSLFENLKLKLFNDCEITQPLPAGHAKIKDRYRFHLFIRCKRIYAINEMIDEAIKRNPPGKDVKILIDVNPLSTFF